MWVSRRRWRELRAAAAQAEPAMFECDQLRERVVELESENASLRSLLLRSSNPGRPWLDTDPTRRYIPPPRPREYGTDTDVSEAAVAACGYCGLPHPVAGPCAGQIKEAA